MKKLFFLFALIACSFLVNAQDSTKKKTGSVRNIPRPQKTEFSVTGNINFWQAVLNIINDASLPGQDRRTIAGVIIDQVNKQSNDSTDIKKPVK